MSQSDQIEFAPEDPPGAEPRPERSWKILIVDDDPEIHAITEVALANFRFDGDPIEFLHAYSGDESVRIMKRESDIAIVLMDVVMESDSAGLDAVQVIREELGISDTRIILRTGQPGQAPPRDVVTRFDINDYKEKTELTATKLFTLIYTSLSLYREIRALRGTQRDLREIGLAAQEIFRRRDPRSLSAGILEQLVAVYRKQGQNAARALSGVVVTAVESAMPIALAGIGEWAGEAGKSFAHPAILGHMRRLPADSAATDERHLIARCINDKHWHTAVYLVADGEFTHPDDDILTLFFGNVSVALENSYLSQEIRRAQHEMVLTLSEAIERRSLETGNHVRRVGEYCGLLAQLSGLPEDDVNTLRVAAPLHDAGKIAIPDSILNKPGKHTPDEWEIMKSHAEIGQQMLEAKDQPVLRAASIIAGEHHERWDGMGYPRKLSGEEIHIYGRIAAVADVYDALCSERCYKPVWQLPDVLELFREERGRQFDPDIVDVFLANVDQFEEIRARLAD